MLAAHLVLDLIEDDPLPKWTLIPVIEATQRAVPDYSGVEVLARSRICDLRPVWNGDGRAHMRERVVGRMPLSSDFPCDLLTVWMLFPENHPYRTHQLSRYPWDTPDAVPEPMQPRYEISHPYGQLIGWSVITPQADTVYECRWSVD